MPTTPLTNIRSVSPQSSITVLGDSSVHQILKHPNVGTLLPELAFAARMLRDVEANPSRGGCGSCAAGRRLRQALEAAKLKIHTMTPSRLAEMKKVLGVQGKLKIYLRQGARIVPVVI